MKIVHVETGRHYYGGAQQVIYLMRGLQRRDVDGLLVCVSSSGIDRVAREAGLPVANIACAGDLDLRFAWRLRQLLPESAPDIVHCHSRRGGDFLGGQAASMAGIPAIVSRRVDNPESGLQAEMRYRPFRKVIAISEAIANMLRQAGLDERRLQVIRSAVDVAAVAASPGNDNSDAFRSAFDLSADQTVLGAIGQLIPRKGHRYLLECVAGLAGSYPGLRLLVFGEGPLDAELKSLANELAITDMVRFVGFRDDLDDMIGNLDIVVHPALAEGLGVALLKAAAAGVPVVAFDAGGVREAVEDGVTGTLVEPENVIALQNAIAFLLDDKEKRERFGAAGRKRMRDEFTYPFRYHRHEARRGSGCSLVGH